MDLTKFLGQDSQEQSAQRLSKEEYAAQKKQEREEIWGMIDGKAQEVFQNGDSLKGFLDFMGQCKPQRTDNLFLLYAQNPEIRQVKTFEKWKEEGKVVKTGSKGYNFIVGQEYEKDGVIQQGYSIQKAYDISQIRTKQPEEAEPKPMDQLMEALLTDSEVRIQIADNLPDKVQAQYIPNKRTIYVRNGMSENATFHSISRELACASLDHHDGSYSRAGVSAQAYCAAYVTAQKYGVDVSGFSSAGCYPAREGFRQSSLSHACAASTAKLRTCRYTAYFAQRLAAGTRAWHKHAASAAGTSATNIGVRACVFHLALHLRSQRR